MVGILHIREEGAGPGGPEEEACMEDVGAPKYSARWVTGLLPI